MTGTDHPDFPADLPSYGSDTPDAQALADAEDAAGLLHDENDPAQTAGVCLDCGAHLDSASEGHDCPNGPDADEPARFGVNVAYPNGRCMACGFGVTEDGACVNPDCTNYDQDADPDYPPTCILTNAPGEDPEDCTTHAHEDDLPAAAHPDTDPGTLVHRAVDAPNFDEAARQEQERAGEGTFAVYARFIEQVAPGQGQFDAIEAVERRVREIENVDEVWNEGRVATNWMPEEQAEVNDPAHAYLIVVRFIERARDGDAAVETISVLLAAAGLDADEVFLAAEYED